MKKLFAKINGYLSAYIGRFYFIEIEEVPNKPERPTKHRLIIRAMHTSTAVQAAYLHCRNKKAEDGKDYAISLIHKI